MDLTILGCDGSWAGPRGAASGYLVRSGELNVVFDMGGGTLGVLQDLVSLSELDAVFISHEHADHFADLYLLSIALFYGDTTREDRLPVYAPAGFRELAGRVLIPGTQEAWDGGFDWRDIAPGDSFDLKNMNVEARAMTHTDRSLGFRITSPEGVLAFSGDTGPDDRVTDLARGADLFLCEATRQEGGEQPFHLTARQAGEYSTVARVDRVVLTHLQPGLEEATTYEQATETFSGELLVARQGLKLEI